MVERTSNISDRCQRRHAPGVDHELDVHARSSQVTDTSTSPWSFVLDLRTATGA
jgi:hypothetical protein